MASTSTSWITADSVSGVGNKTVNITVPAWEGRNNRTSNITLKTADSEVTKIIPVIQAGEVQVSITSKTPSVMPPEGGWLTVNGRSNGKHFRITCDKMFSEYEFIVNGKEYQDTSSAYGEFEITEDPGATGMFDFTAKLLCDDGDPVTNQTTVTIYANSVKGIEGAAQASFNISQENKRILNFTTASPINVPGEGGTIELNGTTNCVLISSNEPTNSITFGEFAVNAERVIPNTGTSTEAEWTGFMPDGSTSPQTIRIRYIVPANTTATTKTYTISIVGFGDADMAGSSVQKTFTVNVSPQSSSLSVSPESLSYVQSGGTKPLNISSNTSWGLE